MFTSLNYVNLRTHKPLKLDRPDKYPVDNRCATEIQFEILKGNMYSWYLYLYMYLDDYKQKISQKTLPKTLITAFPSEDSGVGQESSTG